jgi:hypothetical protein
MDNEQREKLRLKQRIDSWANERLNEKNHQNLNGLRDVLIRNLSENIAQQYDVNKEDAKAFLNESLSNFEFESEYSTQDKEVALILKEYLDGQDPFKQKRGRKRDDLRAWAALYALNITNNKHAVINQFFHAKSSHFEDVLSSMTPAGTLEDSLRVMNAYDDMEGVQASPDTENTSGRKQFNEWWEQNCSALDKVRWLKDNTNGGNKSFISPVY